MTVSSEVLHIGHFNWIDELKGAYSHWTYYTVSEEKSLSPIVQIFLKYKRHPRGYANSGTTELPVIVVRLFTYFPSVSPSEAFGYSFS